jgi:hypothetical protein
MAGPTSEWFISSVCGCHDLIPELRVDLSTERYRGFEVTDLVSLFIKPPMNDGAAVMRITFLFLEVRSHPVHALLEPAECEQYVAQ